MISLVCAIVMMAQATPASAAINFSGDAQVRPRGEFVYTDGAADTSDMKYMYRLRLKAAADLGDGYFAKAMIASETPGWLTTVGPSNTEKLDLGVSHLYFGRMMEDSHYVMGRIPQNSFNNPIFDISLQPLQPLELPVFINNNDRLFAFNYGTEVGPGELNCTLSVLNNGQTSEDMFEDGYGIHVMYKTNIGNVTFEPQMLAAISDSDIGGGNFIGGTNYDVAYQNVKPLTFGANITVPADDVTFSFSGFYSYADEDGYTYGSTGTYGKTDYAVDQTSKTAADVEYSSYLLRAKAVYGPLTTWIDYSAAEDKTAGASVEEYKNLFVWAQYKYTVHESSMGTFSLAPTVRYLSTDQDDADVSRLRTELWANVTF